MYWKHPLLESKIFTGTTVGRGVQGFIARNIVGRKSRAELLFQRALCRFRAEGFIDIHTHLMPWVRGAKFNSFARLGPDQSIAYHYAYGEALSELRLTDSQLEAFWELSTTVQADWIVSRLFNGRMPISEGTHGLVSMANRVGVDTSSGDFPRILQEWRTLFRDRGEAGYIDDIFRQTGIRGVIGTNSPFSKEELEIYLDDQEMERWDKRVLFALRLDELIHGRMRNGCLPPELAELCELMGFPKAAGDIHEAETQSATRALVTFWIQRFDAKYAAVSLSEKTQFASADDIAVLVLENAIIPACVEAEIPVVLMPFVQRQIKPLHGNAGDVVKRGDINGLIEFVGRHPEALFLVTPLDANDNYYLSMATRALGNLRMWGHWWCNLNPSLIKQQLQLRLENNGYVHHGINTDSRIWDQLSYKPDQYFYVVGEVLVDHACYLEATSGWRTTEEQFLLSLRELQDADGLFNLAKKDRPVVFTAAA